MINNKYRCRARKKNGEICTRKKQLGKFCNYHYDYESKLREHMEYIQEELKRLDSV